MNRRRLLIRLSQGHLRNVPFQDLVHLAEGLEFRLVGDGKPYQIRQLLRLVERYNLSLEA